LNLSPKAASLSREITRVIVSGVSLPRCRWFEVFLGGQWHTFDARDNTPRIGRVLIARGRDAADVALSNTWTDEVPAG
jgi:hypothetical protein